MEEYKGTMEAHPNRPRHRFSRTVPTVAYTEEGRTQSNKQNTFKVSLVLQSDSEFILPVEDGRCLLCQRYL